MGEPKEVAVKRRGMTIVLIGERTLENEQRRDAMERRGWRVVLLPAPPPIPQITAQSPAAVVLDEGGRPSDGVFALAKRFRTDVRVPVLVLTRLRMPAIANAARAAACVCISVPCRPSSVVASVLSVVAVAGGSQWRMRQKKDDESTSDDA